MSYPDPISRCVCVCVLLYNGNPSIKQNKTHIFHITTNKWINKQTNNSRINHDKQRLEWPSSDEDIKVCQVKGKSPEQCQNYIRVLKLKTPDTLFVCGTNAYKPRCRTYLITVSIFFLMNHLIWTISNVCIAIHTFAFTANTNTKNNGQSSETTTTLRRLTNRLQYRYSTLRQQTGIIRWFERGTERWMHR